jgi:hypothetical protein
VYEAADQAGPDVSFRAAFTLETPLLCVLGTTAGHKEFCGLFSTPSRGSSVCAPMGGKHLSLEVSPECTGEQGKQTEL